MLHPEYKPGVPAGLFVRILVVVLALGMAGALMVAVDLMIGAVMLLLAVGIAIALLQQDGNNQPRGADCMQALYEEIELRTVINGEQLRFTIVIPERSPTRRL